MLVGRYKSMIRRRGENISPQEVEDVLLMHPSVQLVAVVGIPSDLSEEEVAAAIVPAPGAEIDPDELTAWCAQYLAPFKVPTRFVVRESLPMACNDARVTRSTRAGDCRRAVMTPLEQAQELNAFISLTGDDGDGPKVGVKDLIDVRGTVTTAGSPLRPDVRAEHDAPLIERLRAAGCVLVGKTNLHEWAYGPTSDNPHFGPVRNPHDPTRIAGGSSGGSAAAVAVDACDWAIGTDTGGSIRIPAGLCGIVGFKPSLGAIPTDGVVPLAWSLDTIGSLAPDVATAFSAVELMRGVAPAPLEPTSSAPPRRARGLGGRP